MHKSVVAIVGSPNVGKSTIFNRIVGKRHSIVDDEPGITRDRIYAKATWLTRDFSVIDTGGIELENRPFQTQIRAQAEIAIEEADIIVFICDARLGVTSDDRLVAKILYKCKKPIILVVNKVDDKNRLADVSDFYSLGLGNPIPASGIHGIGIGDILDKIVSVLPPSVEEVEDDSISFALIGRPNVGKSSLVNAILNENRVIVSSIEGTTRDSIDTSFVHDDRKYVVIDTAGLKKRGKIYEAIDKYSALRALKAIERSDIVLLLIDASTGIQEQDKRVVSYAMDEQKAIIIVVNKWDLVEKSTNTMSDFSKNIRKEFKFLDYAPIIYVSAKTKERIHTIFNAIDVAFDGYTTRVQTSTLNEVFQDAQLMNEPPDFNGGRIKILFANQVAIKPPTFVLFCNEPSYMHFSYKRYLENRLRDTFDFEGSPLNIILRKRS